jgi:hypothetical protein
MPHLLNPPSLYLHLLKPIEPYCCTVFRDHAISIAYDHLPPLLGNEGSYTLPYYSTGLRSGGPRGPLGGGGEGFASFSAAQRAVGNSVWSGQGGTTVAGVYPASLREVRSGRQFNICPTSRAWCLQPAVLGLNQSESLGTLGTLGGSGGSGGLREGLGAENVTLSALMLGCVGGLHGVQFGVLLAPSWEVGGAAVVGNTSALVCGALGGAGAGADTPIKPSTYTY